MRVAIGGIYHESNTFVTATTSLDGFGEAHLHYGEDLIAHWHGTASEIAGFLAAGEEFRFEVVPTLMAWGMPSGIVTSTAFETLAGELVSRLKAAAPLHGVLLSLHGAMVSENYADADGEILRRVRRAVGPQIPVVVTIDYHANVTPQMVEFCDAMIGYDTYPHIDQFERAQEAASILRGILTGRLRPVMWLARRPLLPHILKQVTGEAPVSDLLACAHDLETRSPNLTVTVCAGFPYCDVPDAGFSVIAVSNADREAAHSAAEQIADQAWERRDDFTVRLPGPEDAVRCALAADEGLTVLADVSDNLGAGTPGDGTVLLAELLRQGAQDALVLLPDRAAVATAITAGVRETVTLTVGAKGDRYHGEPVRIDGVVRVISDGVFRNIGPMRDGVLDDQGRTAVIDAAGLLVVLTERRMPMWNLQQLRALGIEPTRLSVVVVKGAIAHRAAYGPIARRMIEVDTPGLAPADIRRLDYQRLRRPVFPLDAI